MEWNNFNLTVQQFLGCGDKLMMGTLFGISSMYPFCLVSSAQAAMGGLGINSWQALGPLVSDEHCLRATAYSYYC